MGVEKSVKYNGIDAPHTHSMAVTALSVAPSEVQKALGQQLYFQF